MFKKRLALWFLCMATFIMVGHDLVPHHHHNENLPATNQCSLSVTESGTHWHHLFSYLSHSDSGILCVVGQEITSKPSKKTTNTYSAILPDFISPKFSLDFSLVKIFGKKKPPVTYRIFCTSGLRAPPINFV